MDLNELLHAHQVAVMKAGEGADPDLYGQITDYAEQIRRLRPVETTEAVPPDRCAPPMIIYGSYAGDSLPADAARSDRSDNPGSGRTDD